ncbi:MAG TPA: glycosyltransferase family 39 protein [Gammaproteobacteria bacterium]|nr:glycosyltransferase family 39 protein [Gammaproteobacteria bacterium]
MINNFTRSFPAERWLSLFIFLHIVLWTLTPAIVRYTLPMDAMEGTIWGHQLVLGYDKNPFLNAWLTRLAIYLGNGSSWMIYLFSQLSVAICFWATFQLGKKYLPPLYALIAVLLLESMQYYNLHAIDFNDNTLELGLWALTILYFYQATRENKLSDWLLTGLFAGLGMMAKYYTAMLLIPMAIFLLIHPIARERFKSSHLYFGLLIFVIIILPHTLWLFSHDFITVDYAVERISSPPTLLNHVEFPLQFTWQQLEVLLPALLVFSILLLGKKPVLEKREPLSTFDKTFLLFMGFGPLLMTVLLSALFGMRLRAGWGQPLLSLSGIMLMTWLTPRLTRERFYSFIAFLLVLSFVMISMYSAALIRGKEPSSANFPGEMIAHDLTQQWQQHYHKPLLYVAGPRWMAGNIAFYSSDQPTVYIDWNPKVSSWIDENKVRQEGAIFVWDPTEEYQTAEKDIRVRFKNLGPTEIMHFSWMRNKTLEPVEVRVAFLPPE